MENRMKNRFMGRNIGTHFLLLITVMIWGSTWAAGRFLSFGLNEGDLSKSRSSHVCLAKYHLP